MSGGVYLDWRRPGEVLRGSYDQGCVLQRWGLESLGGKSVQPWGMAQAKVGQPNKEGYV